MICPECKEQGLESRVYPGGRISTLLANHPWYDEKGVYHFHDMNRHTASFSCSKGHRWTEDVTPKCPAGDYP